MPEDSAIIDIMINEHQAIRGHLKLLRDSLLTLKGEDTSGLGDKIKELQVAIGYLREGLQSHYAHEEKVMAPLLGNKLLEAFKMEHHNVEERLTKARSLFADLAKKSPEELPAKRSEIRQTILVICETVEAHSLKEDILFNLLKSVQEKD